MTFRSVGIILFAIFYIAACAATFTGFAAGGPGGSGALPLAPVAAAAAAVVFGAAGAPQGASPRATLAHRLLAAALAAGALLTVLGALPDIAAVLIPAAGAAAYAWEFARCPRFVPRAAAAALALLCCVALPLPGAYTAVPASPSSYASAGATGQIQAPNVKERPLLVGEWIAGQGTPAKAYGRAERPSADLASTGIDIEVLESLYQLPYDVPESLYALEDAETDPHAVMKVLARWIEWTGEDETQGQTVMGVGAVAPDGKILMVDNIEVYVKAASAAKPKVFFVPVEAYETVREIDKSLLAVPVSGFKEVLYFLDQPVTFWPLRNFALFCH